MSEKRLYVPPEYAKTVKPVIFLAGPIQGTSDWQARAIEIIHDLNPNAQIASPRRSRFDKDEDYNAQVDWETHHLRKAGANGTIMFWLAKETEHDPKRAFAQTSRAELFEWKIRHERDGVNLVVGIENGFSGARYIQRRFSQDAPNVPILSTLEETCQTALGMIQDDLREVPQSDDEDQLRKDVDRLIVQLFPDPKSKRDIKIDSLGQDWAKQMPNIHQSFSSSIRETTSLILYPNFFPAYKLFVSFGFMNVTFVYFKNGRTEVTVGTDEWDRKLEMMVRKTKTDDEESGEVNRLSFLKEVAEFALMLKRQGQIRQ